MLWSTEEIILIKQTKKKKKKKKKENIYKTIKKFQPLKMMIT